MANTTDIQNLYIAYFNRPADVAGLAYWTAQNMSLGQIAQSFSVQPEYASTFAGFTVTQTIDTLYNNLFNHYADSAGLAYWGGQINKGTVTIGQVAIAILMGATGADAACVAAKLSAANSFTGKMAASMSLQAAYSRTNGNAFDLTKTWLAGVADTSSGIAAVGKMNEIFMDMPDPAKVYIVVQPGVETQGTAGNDIFLATDETLLTSGTSIKGNGGTDVLSVSHYLSNAVHPTIVTGISTLNLLSGDYQLSTADPFLNQFSTINDYRASDEILLGNVAQTLNLYNSDSAGVVLGAPGQVIRQLSKSKNYVEIGTTNANLAGAVFDLDHTIQSASIDSIKGPFGNALNISDAGTTTLSAAQLKNFTWVSLSEAENLTLSPATVIMVSVDSAGSSVTEGTGAGDVAIYLGGLGSFTLNTVASHFTKIYCSGPWDKAVTLSGTGNVVINAAEMGKFTLTGSAGLVTINLPDTSNAVDNITVTDSTLGNIASKLFTINNLSFTGAKVVLHTGADSSSMDVITIATSDFNSLAGNIASCTGTFANNDHKAFKVDVTAGTAAGSYLYEHMNGTTVGGGDIIVKLTGYNGSVSIWNLQA